MDGSLVFVHGTGVRDISASMQRIRAGAQRLIGLPPEQVHGLEWGLAVGPQDLDVRPALPPDVATRALNAEPTDSERGYALWNLLVTDPSLELRLLASSTPPAAVPVVIGADPPALVMQRRLEMLEVTADVLGRCGITTATLKAAAHEVSVDPALLEAATALGAEGEAEVASAAARSMTARLLATCGGSGWDEAPPLCLVGTVRDEFVDAVTARLAPGTTRGIITSALGQLLGPLAARTATRAAVARRESLMDPLSDFIRDVAFYVRNGDRVRSYIAEAIAPLPRPVVLLGHSLGGIASVDLLSRSDSDPPLEGPVDLLVTVGSQAPLLYLMGALATLEPGGQGVPFEPWLNVYNRSDLLSFCASRVFPNATHIWDEEVDAGVPFPASHSAYWMVDRVFKLIAQRWPTA